MLYAAIAGLVLFLLILLIILLLLRRRRKKKQRALADEAAALDAAAAALAAAQNQETSADIMDIHTERSMELRKDVRKFAENNPEIAALMVRNWLNEEDDKKR